MVPFKTPLDARYKDHVPPQYLFTPAMLVQWADSLNVGAAARGVARKRGGVEG